MAGTGATLKLVDGPAMHAWGQATVAMAAEFGTTTTWMQRAVALAVRDHGGDMAQAIAHHAASGEDHPPADADRSIRVRARTILGLLRTHPDLSGLQAHIVATVGPGTGRSTSRWTTPGIGDRGFGDGRDGIMAVLPGTFASWFQVAMALDPEGAGAILDARPIEFHGPGSIAGSGHRELAAGYARACGGREPGSMPSVTHRKDDGSIVIVIGEAESVGHELVHAMQAHTTPGGGNTTGQARAFALVAAEGRALADVPCMRGRTAVIRGMVARHEPGCGRSLAATIRWCIANAASDAATMAGIRAATGIGSAEAASAAITAHVASTMGIGPATDLAWECVAYRHGKNPGRIARAFQ